ncbi:MAG: tyrosine-type recombinase/integrase [Bacteroidota bacterium]
MKKKLLQNAEYKLLLQSFTEWLQLLNYSSLSIPGLSGALKEFLQYQEQNNKSLLQQLAATDANEFITHLQNKTGERTKKAFSNNHINKYIQSLKLFSRYIRETGRSIIAFNLHRLEDQKNKPVWLTKNEINQLYEAIPDTVLGVRDKAMLAVYYGCGLRLNEGASLELNDIDVTRKVLHVRKGKHYKERFVPVADKNFGEIKLYLDYARPQLLQEIKTTALFIDANKGHPMHKQSLYVRIKKLVKKAAIKKKVGTHTLRHSIATHLLQSGMKLERIQQFLGHADLDSTQIYTHLLNKAL